MKTALVIWYFYKCPLIICSKQRLNCIFKNQNICWSLSWFSLWSSCFLFPVLFCDWFHVFISSSGHASSDLSPLTPLKLFWLCSPGPDCLLLSLSGCSCPLTRLVLMSCFSLPHSQSLPVFLHFLCVFHFVFCPSLFGLWNESCSISLPLHLSFVCIWVLLHFRFWVCAHQSCYIGNSTQKAKNMQDFT